MKSVLAIILGLTVVSLSVQSPSEPPIAYAPKTGTELCPTYANDPNAVGDVSPTNPCQVICLSKGKSKTINKSNGEECGSATPLPQVCYNGKCESQVDSAAAGAPCISAGAASYLAIMKPNQKCTLICMPPTSDTTGARSFEIAIKQGTRCANSPRGGTCSGTKCVP